MVVGYSVALKSGQLLAEHWLSLRLTDTVIRTICAPVES